MRTRQQLVKQLVVCGAMFVGGIAGLVGYGASRAIVVEEDEPAEARKAPGVSHLVINTGTTEAVVHIDGWDTDLLTPITGKDTLVIPAGNHVVTFFTSTGEAYTYSVRTVEGPNTLVIPQLGQAALTGDAIPTSQRLL